MAFFTNLQNVGTCLFVKDNDILIHSLDFTNTADVISPKALKCEPSVIIQTSDDSAKKAKKKSKDPESFQNIITSATISNCNSYIAAGDANNFLHLWKYTNQQWAVESVRSLSRKAHKVMFTNSSSEIVVADRSGDVFTFSISNSSDPGLFKLGHISLILDMAISSSDKYLATCDRDGKIRVSCYPNCYNIVSYCLGHQEFVSSVQFLQLDEEVLMSSSGDGAMIMWNFMDGSSKSAFQFYEDDSLIPVCDVDDEKSKLDDYEIPSDKLVLNEKQVSFSVRNVKFNPNHKLIAVMFYMQNGVAIYQLSNGGGKMCVFKQFLHLGSPPLDAVFSACGDLCIFTSSKKNHVVCFEFDKTSVNYQKVVGSDLPTVKSIQCFYKEHKQIPFQEDFCSLFKRAYYDTSDGDCIEPSEKKNKAE